MASHLGAGTIKSEVAGLVPNYCVSFKRKKMQKPVIWQCMPAAQRTLLGPGNHSCSWVESDEKTGRGEGVF